MNAPSDDSPLTPQALRGTVLPLAWSHGSAEIWALSAGLHHLSLRLPDGRVVRPLADAAWQDDALLAAQADIPAHHRQLGGEWACAPFGRSRIDPVLHGHATNAHWDLSNHVGGVKAQIDLPDHLPVARLERTITPVPGDAALDFTFTITARRDCTLPVGLHPIARLPDAGRALALKAEFRTAITLPAEFEPGASRFAVDARFQDLDAIPLAGGGRTSFAESLITAGEEGIILRGCDGHLALHYPDDGYALRLDWQSDHFPDLLLWLSNRGRTYAPWNGRFRGLGIEPVNAYFRLSSDGLFAEGGRSLSAGQPFTTAYRLSVEML